MSVKDSREFGKRLQVRDIRQVSLWYSSGVNRPPAGLRVAAGCVIRIPATTCGLGRERKIKKEKNRP